METRLGAIRLKIMSGPQCCENPPGLDSASGVGSVQELGGLKAYVTGPQDSKLAILLISDVFGYEAPLLRKLADKVAAAGFLTVVPDFLDSDPFDVDNPQFDRESWLKAHPTGKGCEDAKKVIAALKSKGVSAVGAAGFCWGGVVVVKLAKFDDIKAGVVLHPGPLTVDEINEVKIPIAILGAEIDKLTPPEQVKHFGEILSAKPHVDSFVKIFPGVAHGWAVRYNAEDESAIKSAEEAHVDMLNWFTNTGPLKIMSGPQCCENPPSLDSASGVGSVQEVGGLKTYVTGPQDSKLAILLIHDAFGYEAPLLRKLADKVAAVGFLVVVPDFLYGDPFDIDNPQFDRQSWIKAHPMGKGCEDAKKVIAALKSKGVSAVGAAGFCWGGVIVVKLAKFDDIQAGVVLHPGPLTVDEINEVKIPIAILGAEIDNYTSPEQVKQFGEILSARPGVDSFVKIFPGVAHGWAVRYNAEDESAVKSAEEAHVDLLNWLTKTLVISCVYKVDINVKHRTSPQCCENPPSLDSASGVGSVQELGGLKTYVTGSQDSKRAILLIHDAFGYEAPLLRKLADKVAALGFLVVVPDFLYSDPVDVDNPQFDREAWLKAHSTGKGCEDAKKVIAALKSKGVSAVGAAGFCWGGVVVVKLAKFDEIQAGVVLHPGPLTVDEINEVKIPIAILGAEIDKYTSPEEVKHFGEILSAKPHVESFVKVFPGVAHGWAVRYNAEDESAVKSLEMSGPQCCENPPVLSSSSGAGNVEELGGLKSYISGSPDSSLAVLLVSDVYGYEAPNLRKLADKVAAAGFYVVVPDFLRRDPYVPENAERPLQVWIKEHGADQAFECAKPVIEAIKSKGVTKVGSAGFCWGAKVVVELAKYSYVLAAVLLHPSFVTVDDIHGVKVPISILGAEIDKMSPPELLKQFEATLNAKPEVDGFVKIFPGVSHGWTMRYKVEDKAAVKSAEEAHKDMLNWFVKYLKPWNKEKSSTHLVLLRLLGTQEGVDMSGPQCCENPPALSSSSGAGHEEELGGLKSYISGSPDSGLAVLLISDVFGYEAPNLRKLADKVAAAGFYVVVPDFLRGDPREPGDSERPLQVWIKEHGPDEAFECAKPVIEAIKSKGVTKVGAAGCCWGAKVVVELAKYSYVQAAVLLHPSFVTVDDIHGVKVDGFVKIFPGVSHGWAVRYKVEDKAAVKSAEEAHKNMLNWFVKYLK
ncbi:hypothetical protein RJ640_028865 [Escallonia rubra]|uniref:Dienelactone hydrolase domain-containing protein n=1 Tax=Escallonia rubra TaxID=112253 RepID=A0AA88R3F6_9ASTE|nr:hypothetical protein RJ640_028865 [Escallonia rubra]